ncbi:MAG: family 1 glycosylhydrolase [Burkholderiaceae bacterium]
MSNPSIHDLPARPLEIWGGLECTVNRVLDDYFSQMERNGHALRRDDLERFASLGIRAIRYPVLWERVAPDGIEHADWSWPDERLLGLRHLGVTPIVGLVHHGSGPRHTSLVDPAFAEQLAAYAGMVARRYPWIAHYTPVNEPLTTARFSGLYGVWYPHGRDERTFIQALLNQCRATVLAMRAIRAVNPDARLVQTDDISKTYSTPEMAELADFYNERRWLSWDLLCGRVDERHPLWGYLAATGIDHAELLWCRDNPCPPDIVGLNYYPTSERWLDHRTDRYPQQYVGSYRGFLHADIETPRSLATPTPGIAPLLQETWERYGLPIAVTEAHIDASREDQMRWLLEIWDAARQARAKGADVRAVTVWSLLGSFDWNCLVTECRGYYEPGPFDVRSPEPRPTALAGLIRELSAGRPLSHPVLHGLGWWRRPERFRCPPVATRSAPTSLPLDSRQLASSIAQPIVILGASGTLGSAFARICRQRNLHFHVLSRQELDMTDPDAVERMIARYQPWAIVNAAGYVRVDEAEKDMERCLWENAHGPSVLAVACARHDIELLTFSSDLVFDGRQQKPYVESDAVAPLNAYGRSKVQAERRVLATHPASLVVRTSAFFSPWDSHNFITQALRSLGRGERFAAANDMTVSPTYVPDLVHACLDLLIDRESGLWHLTNSEPVTWADLAQRAGEMAGMDTAALLALPAGELGHVAARPRYSALHSQRAVLLPTLDDALARYVRSCREAAVNDAAPAASCVAAPGQGSDADGADAVADLA